MWFKNVCFYRFTQPISDNSAWAAQEKLESLLSEELFSPCGLQQTTSIGWVSPIPGGSELTHFANNRILLCMKRQERLLPGSVVNELLQEEVEKISAKESRKVTRKERLELKEKITAELLPKAFVRSTLNYLYIDIAQELLIIASASANRADEITELLRTTVKSLPVVPLAKDMEVGKAMTAWLANPTTMPQGFEVGEEMELKLPVEGEPVLKVKNMNILDEDFDKYLADGWKVEKMALKYSDQIELMLDSDCSIKRLKYTDELVEKSYDMNPDADKAIQADADFTLCSAIISEFAQVIVNIKQ
jgi:recombination associated protein RdgC